MRHPHEVILGPLITEKVSRIAEKQPGVVAFKVRRDANKLQIQDAVQRIWDVKVASVRTMNRRGKIKRLGRFAGRRASWKKAIVTLAEGHSIPDFTA